MIRLHDLRLTHGGLLPADGVPVGVAPTSGQVNATVHQLVYQGLGREAADRFVALLDG
jgi:hypothetical protein